MDDTHEIDGEQAALWNGPAGRAWVEAQALLDRMFEPFEDLLVDAVAAESASRGARRRLRHRQHTLAVARRSARRAAASASTSPSR